MDLNDREPSPDLEVVYVKEATDEASPKQRTVWDGHGTVGLVPELFRKEPSTSSILKTARSRRGAEDVAIIDESDPLELTWSDLVREASEGTSTQPAQRYDVEDPARTDGWDRQLYASSGGSSGVENDSFCGKQVSYPQQCEMCSQGFAPLHFLLGTPSRNVLAKPGTCETCGEKLPKLNLEGKSRGQPYTCSQCGKAFQRLGPAGRDEASQVICGACSKGQNTNGEGNHSEGNMYDCEHCGQRCYTAFDLYEHSFVHFGQKPYKCEKCNKRFTNVVRLEKHLKLHSRRKDRTCKVCNKSFLSNSSFTTHNQLHSDERFCCNKCDMTYQTKQALYKHSKVHREEKPFMCHICDEKFSLLKLLRSHSMEHWQ